MSKIHEMRANRKLEMEGFHIYGDVRFISDEWGPAADLLMGDLAKAVPSASGWKPITAPAKKGFFSSLRNLHVFGCDVLGGGAAIYTDAPTIKKVQAALGVAADGKIGPNTKAAAVKANADLLSVSSDAITDDLIKALKIDTSSVAPVATKSKQDGTPLPSGGASAVASGGSWDSVKNAVNTTVPGVNLPAWQVGLGALGAIGVGYGVYRVIKR